MCGARFLRFVSAVSSLFYLNLFGETVCKIHVTAMSVSSSTTTSRAYEYFIGFDLGTSGARISIITPNEKINLETDADKDAQTDTHNDYEEVYSDATLYDHYDDPKSWTTAIDSLLKNTPTDFLSNTKSICVSGTSASCLVVNNLNGKVTRSPKMYDFDITHNDDHQKKETSEGEESLSAKAKRWIDTYAPKNHAARANTSALSKLLHYHACSPLQSSGESSFVEEVLAHQSEYVANTMFLSQTQYTSDWHNALKLGYDVKELTYPKWLLDCLNDDEIKISPNVLPKVVQPGEVIGNISMSCHEVYGIGKDAVVVGGTTDSNAAFIAAAAASGSGPSYGTAVTSLGSTLAIKMLSKSFVEDSERGVYSHRFPVLGKRSRNADQKTEEEEAWLVGGASNVGCAILRQEQFSNEELIELSQDMDVTTDSPYEYYPLTKMGERFPIADGMKEPNLDPKPEQRLDYLKGILQGISSVERLGFEVLGNLGADPSFPQVVMTCGGGSKNDAWLQMRQRLLREKKNDDDANANANVEVKRAGNAEASFGAAFLAASSFSN